MTERDKFEAWVTEYRKGKPYWSTAREEILWDGWQGSRRAVLEEAAQICDDFAIDKWNLYKGRPPYNNTEDGRANSYVEGESDGAEGCATAIRALADGETRC